jgi:geranylgeranyl diphosphate synthase type II
MSFNLKDYLNKKQELINKKLDYYLPVDNSFAQQVVEAMRYSVLAGGKRLRPILALAGAEAVGGKLSEDVIKVACALEYIHTYSLIHDDLPAMDNDSLRRGKPTCHMVFGEALAILAGDALLNYSFELLTSINSIDAGKNRRLLNVIREIALCSGFKGMIGGQVADIISEKNGTIISKNLLTYIHKHKTAALFRASIKAGAIIVGATEKELEYLDKYAYHFGLAFQITDDILDIEGNAGELGKPIGSDKRNDKVTFPSLYGLEKSKTMARENIDNAIRSIANFADRALPLVALAEYVLQRNN